MRAKEVLTKEKILGTVAYRMMNKAAGAELLDQMPHVCIMDLAAVYYCILSQEEDCHTGAFITWECCRHYGIQKEELDAAAGRNTKAAGFYSRRLSSVLGIREDCFPEFMYFLTNRERRYGASVILYPDYLGKLAGEMGTDLYILPSSIHEVIAVTVSGMDPSALQDIVKEVNGTKGIIRPDEVLSNNVYRYRRDGGLTCVTGGNRFEEIGI